MLEILFKTVYREATLYFIPSEVLKTLIALYHAISTPPTLTIEGTKLKRLYVVSLRTCSILSRVFAEPNVEHAGAGGVAVAAVLRSYRDVASSGQRTTSKTGAKTIRLSGPLPCEQACHQFYAVDGLGRNDCTGR